jgi:hypothetical protein
LISELFRKWFNLDPRHCEACEILRIQLDESNRERKELLHRLLDKDKVEPPPAIQEEYKPITPQFTPWRVKQQMLEAEDRKKAQLMKDRAKEIAELENELGVNRDVSGASGGVKFDASKIG